MGKIHNLTGRVFGRLIVRQFAGLNQRRRATWHCDCRCGTVAFIAAGTELCDQSVMSCGCLRNEKSAERTRNRHLVGELNGRYSHGMRHTSTYGIWCNMITRATNPRANIAYQDVGIVARWRVFENFIADMGTRPSPKHSLSRHLDFGDYAPGNVEWGTKANQVAEHKGKHAMQLMHVYHQGFEAGRAA